MLNLYTKGCGNMKIESSTIALSSTRSYEQLSSLSISSNLSRGFSSLTLSNEGRQKSMQMRNQLRALSKDDLLEANKTNKTESPFSTNTKESQIETLKQLLAALRDTLPNQKGHGRKSCVKEVTDALFKNNNSTLDLRSPGNMNGMTWVRTTSVESFFYESESTTFQGNGVVKTADGREISFNIDLSLSRSYMEYSC